jgi:Fe-S cluster assembly protein SufD
MTSTMTVDETTEALISAAAVEELSSKFNDTDAIRARRESAWAIYEQTPMPTRKDEHWRFTNLRHVKLDEIPVFSGEGDPDAVTHHLNTVADGWDGAAHAVHVNGEGNDSWIKDAGLPAGVIFTTLDRATREHADLLDRYFGKLVAPTTSVNDKFVALQEATNTNGLVVFVPRNTRVELPLRADIVHAGDASHVNWRLLVIAEEGADVTLVEQYSSIDADDTGFANAVAEVFAGASARVKLVTLQDFAKPVTTFATYRANAERDAQIDWTVIGLGASLGKWRMETHVSGPGAHIKLNGAYILDGRRTLDYDTLQVHHAGNAVSDLSFRGVLSEKGHSVWRGMIDVRPGAQGTDSYQENRNLLLNAGAHADSIPGLQIEANEVRCTHAATISKVDAEQLFYLLSRGIDRATATAMIVRGFITPLVDRVEPEAQREAVRSLLDERLEDLSL